MLITPDGHRFVALGVNHFGTIKANGPNEPDLLSTRCHNDWEQFAEEMPRQYEAGGFNTVDDPVKPLRDARSYLAKPRADRQIRGSRTR